MAGAAYYRGFLLEADTSNASKSLAIRDAETGALHAYTGGPSPSHIQHNGQTQIEYSFTTPFVAHLVRYEPLDQVPWRLFGLRWVADQWPELTIEASPWIPVLNGGAAFLQGFVIPAEAGGATPSLTLLTDGGASVALTPPVAPAANVKTGVPYSLATPVICHEAQIIPSEPCRFWYSEMQWMAQPTPELATTWTTPFTSHGVAGYHHIGRIEAAYAAQSTVAFAITSFDGTSPQLIVLPATGGAYQKLLITPTANKGMLYRYSAVSAQAFQIFINSFLIYVGQWARQGPYLQYRLLGGQYGDAANI